MFQDTVIYLQKRHVYGDDAYIDKDIKETVDSFNFLCTIPSHAEQERRCSTWLNELMSNTKLVFNTPVSS